MGRQSYSYWSGRYFVVLDDQPREPSHRDSLLNAVPYGNSVGYSPSVSGIKSLRLSVLRRLSTSAKKTSVLGYIYG